MIEPEEEFETFWKLYPRRKGKGDARKAFKRARKQVEFSTLMEGLRAYTQWCAAEMKESRYICHPSTWLNQERWEDEYDEPANAADDAFDRILQRYAGGDDSQPEGDVIQLDPTAFTRRSA